VTASIVRLSETVITHAAGRWESGAGKDPRELAALIRRIAVDRVAFGTNHPMAELARCA
jgi:hypothetical protein